MEVTKQIFLAFSDNSMIKLYCKDFSFLVISSYQRGCRVKNNFSSTYPTLMVFPGHSISSRISGDCCEVYGVQAIRRIRENHYIKKLVLI